METANEVKGPTTTVGERLADHAVGLRFEDIPSVVVERAKELLVLHLGIAFAGTQTVHGQRAIAIAHELSNGAGDTTIIGQARRANLLDSVFANSALLDGLNDFHPGSGTHPGIIVLPVALALAEQRQVRGRDLLASIVVGYDVLCRLGSTAFTWSTSAPRRPNAVFGPFGAAATAARLMGLDRSQSAEAFGHAAHSGMGVIEGVGFSWHLWPRIARNGLFSAQLARAGVRSAPTTIEGPNGMFQTFFGAVPPNLDDHLDRLGHEFEVISTETKRFRSSGRNIVPLLLMLELARAGQVSATNLASVKVVLPEQLRPNHTVMERELTDHGRSAQSLRFLLSLALVDGELQFSRYNDLGDPRIQAVLPKVQLDFEVGRPFLYARLEIRTSDGREFSVERDSYEFPPLDWAAWLRADGTKVVSQTKLDRLLDLVTHLERVEDASALTECLRPGP